MVYEPTPHQVEDSDLMLEYEHALVWADAGTGKTVTAMEALRKGDYKKAVILAPKLALPMWQEELALHLGWRSVILHTGKPPNRKLNVHDASALITTFDLAGKHDSLIRDFCKGGAVVETGAEPRSAMILDEAHLCKSPIAKRTQAIFGPGCTGRYGLVRYVTDVWEMTGTPIMRYPDDLWSQLRYARGDTLAAYGVTTHSQFVDMFCTTELRSYQKYAPQKKVVTGAKNIPTLSRLLNDCKVIRRALVDVVDDMPAIRHRIVGAEYRNVKSAPTMSEQRLMAELNNPNSVMSAIRRQLGMAKAGSVVDYAAEFGRLPLLIGAWHRSVIAEIVNQIELLQPNWVVEIVDGSVNTADREAIKDAFNAGRIDVLVGQMQSMNASWNLQEACSHVLIAEEVPSPGLLHQFCARVHRRGQKNNVQVDHMLSDHSLDVSLRNIRLRKAGINKEVLKCY